MPARTVRRSFIHTIVERIRRETEPAHRRLEEALGLSPGDISEACIRRLLERFHGFYGVWEPWVAASGLDRDFFRPRRKLALLEADLRALGADPAGLPAFPHWPEAPTPANVMGSFYVVEGSTLGNQLIRKWISGAPWLPRNGFAYFNGYGAETARMWRAFQAKLLATAAATPEDEIIRAANLTFERLRGWLGDPKE